MYSRRFKRVEQTSDKLVFGQPGGGKSIGTLGWGGSVNVLVLTMSTALAPGFLRPPRNKKSAGTQRLTLHRPGAR